MKHPKEVNIQEIKNILEEDHKREFTTEEVNQAVIGLQNLTGFAFQVAKEEYRRSKLLEDSPNGFHLDSGGTCLICGTFVSKENTWFDKYSLKCMTCQKAIDNKIIPGSVAKNKESWYSKFELDNYFNFKNADIKKYIKQLILKDRIIKGEGNKVHFQLFLIKDNKELLPPKKLLKSKIVKVLSDGEEYFTQKLWYEFIEVKRNQRLCKYKICECLQETFAKPIQSGRFLFKLNPLFFPKE